MHKSWPLRCDRSRLKKSASSDTKQHLSTLRSHVDDGTKSIRAITSPTPSLQAAAFPPKAATTLEKLAGWAPTSVRLLWRCSWNKTSWDLLLNAPIDSSKFAIGFFKWTSVSDAFALFVSNCSLEKLKCGMKFYSAS